jgi:hypothetical protein
MTSRTRRRLTVCLVLGLMTLPAEALLFPVALTPDPRVAAEEWVADLSAEEIAAASANIEHFPSLYRRAIMGALVPQDRSSVWRDQFQKYISAHPALTADQRAVLQDAMDAASPAAFQPPVNAELKERIGQIFARAVKVLGPKDAGELFVTLGPKTVGPSNALPFSERIANSLRSWRVVSASYPDCNCNIEMDTCDLVPDPWLQCSEQYTCNFDLHWPMCGPLWSWACTGWCKIIRWPNLN